MPSSVLSESVDPEITFFFRHAVDKDAISYLAAKAEENGFDSTITQDLTADAEIGVYTPNPGAIPEINAKFSVKIFHGIDSGYSPNRWRRDDWGKFDIGLIPGAASAENWKVQSHNPRSQPRFGAFPVGWPKSDYVFTDEFADERQEYKSHLDLEGEKTVMYAPVRESYGKVFDFVENVRDDVDNIIIKHGPVDEGRSIDDYETLNELYKDLRKYDAVTILDPDDSIYFGLSISDIVVSDNSSVLLDSLVTKTVPVKVTNWPTKRNNIPAQQNIYPDLVQTTRSSELSESILKIYQDYSEYIEQINAGRGFHYSHLGESTTTILSLINGFINNEILPVKPVEPADVPALKYTSQVALLRAERVFKRIKWKAAMNLTEEQKETLECAGVTKAVEKIERKFTP